MKRREFVKVAGMGLAGSTVSHILPALAQPAKRFTEWGWPQPYEPVSAASIKWLREKGWWPLRFGSQPGFTSMPVAVPKGFFKARGLEFERLPFLSGPAINEAAAAGSIQGGLEGNFPFTTLIANDMPVRCVAILNPNAVHSTLVPLDSPLKSIAEIKGMSPTPAFGIVTGSSAEFYFNVALQVHGMAPGKDVILKNLRPPDMLIMPRGLTGVVQWSPWVWDHLYFRKNAKQIDTIYPYNFYMGNYWIRQEIIDNVPDVAQAVVDSFVEGILYTRYDPKDAAQITHEDVMHKSMAPELAARLVQGWNNLYKPTWCYIFKDFWATENARVAAWLKETGRLQKLVTAETYKKFFESRFLDKTFAKVGWKIPERPPWIPANWPGKVGQVPYPPYYNEDTLKEPQTFPEKGDLVKPWYFGGMTYEA